MLRLLRYSLQGKRMRVHERRVTGVNSSPSLHKAQSREKLGALEGTNICVLENSSRRIDPLLTEQASELCLKME